MPAYLTLADFKIETSMANAAVDELGVIAPNFLERKLLTVSATIDARLAKRYDAPFSAPYPLAVVRWLSDIVTREAYLKRGSDPNDPAWTAVDAAATRAEAEIAEAADAADGLFDLPLRADTSASGISRGGPKVISSASPYSWRDEQKRRVDAERRSGGYSRRG